MEYINPGAAATTAFQNYELQRQQMATQDLQNQLAMQREQRLASYEQSEAEQAKERLQLYRREADDREHDRDTSQFEKALTGMNPGDIPDAELVKRADRLGLGHVFPPDPATGVRMYVGSARDREEKRQREEALAFAQTLPPGNERTAFEFQARFPGRTVPASLLKPELKPVFRIGANKRDLEQVGQVPANAVIQPEAQPRPEPTVVVQTVDADGNPVSKIVPKTPGATYDRPLPAQTQTRMYSARQVVSHFDDVKDEIREADRRGLLGPLKGRGADFLAGKIGSTGNPDDDALLGQLRMDMMLIKSGTTMVHFGGRGGQQYIQKMTDVIDSGKMSADELIGAIDGAQKWLTTYGKDPRKAGEAGTTGDTTTPSTEKHKVTKTPQQLWDEYAKGGGD